MSGQILDEKLIGVELSSTKKEFKWPVSDATGEKGNPNASNKAAGDTGDNEDDNDSDDMYAIQKSFHLKSAVLGVGAKADQRNLVHLTVKDNGGEKTILDQPILSLSLNKNDSVSVFNLRVPFTNTCEISLKLVEGDGPVHLITSKVLEPPMNLDNWTSDDEDDEDDDDEEGMLVGMRGGSSLQSRGGGAGDKKKGGGGPPSTENRAIKKAPKRSQQGSSDSPSNNNASSDAPSKKKRKKKNDNNDEE